nr:hypothetical protein [uncultured Nocardioides sp.]
MIHEVSYEGGPGFCGPVFPGLVPDDYHGPLVVALDSNVLIDLQEHGEVLLEGEGLEELGLSEGYTRELAALADLLHIWLLHDIRFIVTPRSLTDAKKPNPNFAERRRPTVQALADALAFQYGDWTADPPSATEVARVGQESGLPDSADRDLVLEAQGVGAHLFITRDVRLLERVQLSGRPLHVSLPSTLAGFLIQAGVSPFGGSTCGAVDCPYADDMPAPDIGKWQPLFSIFE